MKNKQFALLKKNNVFVHFLRILYVMQHVWSYLLPHLLTPPRFTLYWLVLCVNLNRSWSYHRERSFRWGNASMRSNHKAFSQLVIKDGRTHCGWYHLWAGSLGFYKKASWASQRNQVNKSISPSLCISSCFLTCFLTSFGDEQQRGNVSWINPFLPKLLLGHDVLSRSRNPD